MASTSTKWLDRNESADAKKMAIREFQLSKIRPVIKACDKRLVEIFDYLYELNHCSRWTSKPARGDGKPEDQRGI